MTIDEKFRVALEHFQAGKLEEAGLICKSILKKQPKNADALHFLGIIYSQLENYSIAVKYIKKSLRFNTTNPYAYFHLGNALRGKEQTDEAIICYQKALQLNPTYAEAYNNLGNAFQEKGQLDEAITYYQKALQFKMNYVDAYYNLGNALQENKQFDEAIICYQKALQLTPAYFEAYNNLGVVFKEKGQFDEAIACYQKALQFNPNQANVHHNLGYALMKQGRLEEAIESYRCSLQIDPDSAVTLENLGSALVEQGKLNEAEMYYRRAIQIKPDYLVSYEALLMTMNYNSRYDVQTIFSEHLQFAKQHAEPLSSAISPHTNEPIPNRRLRIGYVSPDFRRHSVAYFIEPVLIAHNKEHFEVFCYSNSSITDEVTGRIQEHSSQWRTIIGMSDENVADLIRNDKIDILIDLAGHTANNRILLFARKPAPIQVTWIGYLATTGLSTIDYKIVDEYTDPPGTTEQFYTEELTRLPDSFLCYLPDKNSPQVSALPALTSEHITFGSFNNFVKVSPEVFTLWARILNALPDSRLIMKIRSFSDQMTRQYAIDMFTQKGIAAERIMLQPWDLPPKHLELYNQVDIGLDTFPFNGGTTTCEAMWMGVPVITLAGTAYHSRVGISILSNVGLPELVAKTSNEYISIAVDLAKDLKRLQSLREHLRGMMTYSPLCNSKRFTANLEMCYREMWEKWCQSV